MHDVIMPKLSDSMEVGKILQWRVAEGDKVVEGDVLADVESDKAQMELEAFHDGVVLRIAHGDGDEVPVGEVVAFIGEAGEAVDSDSPATPPAATAPEAYAVAKPKPAPAPVAPAPAPAPAGAPGERAAVSPYARKLAERSCSGGRSEDGPAPPGACCGQGRPDGVEHGR